MGFFDRLTIKSFNKKDSQNRSLFLPWGSVGSAFIVESEEQLTQIQKSFTKMTIWMIFSTIILSFLFGFWLALVLIPFEIVLKYFIVKKMTKNLHRSTEKLSFLERFQKINLPFLIFLELFTLVCLAACLWSFAIGDKEMKSFMGLYTLGFSTLFAVTFGYTIFIKIKNKKSALEISA